MKKLDKFIVLAIWSILGFMYPVRAHAQYPTGYELLCPTNTVLASIANATGFDPSTGQNRAVWCVNPTNGDTYYNDQVTNGGTGGITSLFGAVGVITDSTTFTNTVGFDDPTGAFIQLGTGVVPNGFEICNAPQSVCVQSDVTTEGQLTLIATGGILFGPGAALTSPSINTPGISGGSIAGTITGSPNYTGSPTFVTQTAGNSSTRAATTAFVATSFAPLASPTFTGTVTIPSGASISGFAPLASPTFTGVPAAPTATAGTNNTQLATTAFVNTIFAAPPQIGNTTAAQGSFTVLKGNTLNTGTNCASAISPAGCGTAASGSVALPTGTNPTLVVNSSAVTANSVIELTVDESLGTKLGITCNTTLSTLLNPVVTARTAATSFTFTIGAVIASNPACVNYVILN